MIKFKHIWVGPDIYILAVYFLFFLHNALPCVYEKREWRLGYFLNNSNKLNHAP